MCGPCAQHVKFRREGLRILSEGRKLKKLADLHQIDYRIAELSDLVREATAGRRGLAQPLAATDDLGQLESCDHLLLYLTSETWTSGEASKEFAKEVLRARLQAGNARRMSSPGEMAAQRKASWSFDGRRQVIELEPAPPGDGHFHVDDGVGRSFAGIGDGRLEGERFL